MAHPTEAVYLHDSSLRTLTTEIVSYQPISSLSEDEKSLAKNVGPDDSAITTRQTILYPQGGGQPSDTGSIALADQEPSFVVSLVRKTSDGRIIHFGKLNNADSASFVEGQSVVQRVDGARRDYHSRLHTGGHILGVAMQILMPDLKEVKANHAPKEACLEYEGLLYNDHKPSIQAKVDELVQQDLSVAVSWLEDGAAANGGKFGDGPVRIVSIGGLDQTPCGGTHVERTGLVGPITIRKITRKGGVSKISYEVAENF